MKYLKNKNTGALFPYNAEHANRDYFETVEIPFPEPVNDDDSQDNETEYLVKPKRQYRRRIKLEDPQNDNSGTPDISAAKG